MLNNKREAEILMPFELRMLRPATLPPLPAHA